jgi:4-carboxymuconolactone decarboxylase
VSIFIRRIGPFNPVLFAPEMASCFADLQAAEARYTPLSERVRQVVILAVGAVWKADYELYAHPAVARKAGLSEAAIRSLASGGHPEGLSGEERGAQRFVRQLTAEHHVEEPLYRTAEAAFGREGIVAMTFLAGCYQAVCSFLNAFEIPAPPLKLPRRLSSPKRMAKTGGDRTFQGLKFSLWRH